METGVPRCRTHEGNEKILLKMHCAWSGTVKARERHGSASCALSLHITVRPTAYIARKYAYRPFILNEATARHYVETRQALVIQPRRGRQQGMPDILPHDNENITGEDDHRNPKDSRGVFLHPVMSIQNETLQMGSTSRDIIVLSSLVK